MRERPQPREAAGAKASIYWLGAFGADPVEVAEWKVRVQEFNGALRPVLDYREPKKRTWKRAPLEQRACTIVVLDGWGHGGPSQYKPVDGGRGVMTKYACFDPRWATDYEAWIDSYLALHVTSVTVLADYRGLGAVEAATG